MKSMAKFIILIMYTISIFFIKDLIILGIIFLFNLIISKIVKIKFRDILYNLRVFLPFVIFTVIINIIFDSLYIGILIGIRIIICCNITYIFAKIITISEIAHTIHKLCCPLQVFKINTYNIEIMVSISICMIPILKNEIYELIKALKSKGQQLKLSNIMIIIKSMLISIFIRTSQIEKALISKGYIDYAKN